MYGGKSLVGLRFAWVEVIVDQVGSDPDFDGNIAPISAVRNYPIPLSLDLAPTYIFQFRLPHETLIAAPGNRTRDLPPLSRGLNHHAKMIIYIYIYIIIIIKLPFPRVRR